jgi:nitrite reductase/ring-hydroxylating ferredoxin subunit/ketosteroid isomerase-like protein
MGAKENLELIEELPQAARDRDFDRYGALLTDDGVFRMAGVPASMGGVTTGRQAVVDQFRATAGDSTFALKQMFGDDKHVCVIGRVAAERLPGNAYLQGADHPHPTYECVVYRIANGRVAESTAYINWLDPYVQSGWSTPATSPPEAGSMADELPVCAVSELTPGTVTGAGHYAVGNASGRLFAVSRRCRHLGADLAGGSIDKQGCLVCPWHGARYDVENGRMVRGPQGVYAKVPGLGAANIALTRILPLRPGGGRRAGRDRVRPLTSVSPYPGREASW